MRKFEKVSQNEYSKYDNLCGVAYSDRYEP